MSRSLIAISFILAAAFVGPGSPADGAGSDYGTWMQPATGVIVRIFRCGGRLGMRVLKSAVPSCIGKVYMRGAKRGWNGTFWGKLHNPEDNALYSGATRLISSRRLKLSGCIPGTALCCSEI